MDFQTRANNAECAAWGNGLAHHPARFKHQPRFGAAVQTLKGVRRPLLVFPAPGVTPLLLSLPFPDAEFMVMTSVDDLQRTAATNDVFVVEKLNAFEPFAKKLTPLLSAITAAGYVLECQRVSSGGFALLTARRHPMENCERRIDLVLSSPT